MKVGAEMFEINNKYNERLKDTNGQSFSAHKIIMSTTGEQNSAGSKTMEFKSLVLKFIENFEPNQDIIHVFENECSYWFAIILFWRFIRQNATIVFNKEYKCFGTKIYDNVYGITGDITDKYVWENWLEYSGKDKDEIMSHCIMFE